jgi:cyclase
MQIVEIKPGIFACLMSNQTANAGFVATQRGAIVIDTLNTPALGRDLATAVQARTGLPVLFVINTHHHYDHTFGNQAFDAPIVAHCALPEQLAQSAERDLMPVAIAARISAHPEDRWLANELELVYPHITFERRLVLNLPPARMIVTHMGGHTPDTSIVDLPEAGVVFASDLVFEGRTPFLRQAHIGDTCQALNKLLKLGTRTVVPGHGQLCDMAYVAQLGRYLESLRAKVGELIAMGWDKGDVLDSNLLPTWWTQDRPDLIRANIARVYDELAGSVIST